MIAEILAFVAGAGAVFLYYNTREKTYEKTMREFEVIARDQNNLNIYLKSEFDKVNERIINLEALKSEHQYYKKIVKTLETKVHQMQNNQ